MSWPLEDCGPSILHFHTIGVSSKEVNHAIENFSITEADLRRICIYPDLPFSFLLSNDVQKCETPFVTRNQSAFNLALIKITCPLL